MQVGINNILASCPHQMTMPDMSGFRRPSTPAEYRKKFIERLRAFRITSGKTPAEIAGILGVSKDTYLRWESRTYIPHHLIIPFCEATRADPYTLMTGQPFHLGREIPTDELRQPQKKAANHT